MSRAVVTPRVESSESFRILYQLMQHKPSNTQNKRAREIADAAIKVLICTIAYSATFTTMEMARKNFDDQFRQDLVAYGEAFTTGTMVAWSSLSVYKDLIKTAPITIPRSNDQCSRTAHWTNVFSLGLLSALPSMYVGYYYQDTLFLAFYPPIIFSTFSMLSIHELFKKIFKDKSLSEMISGQSQTVSNQAALAIAKHNFCKILRRSFREISKEDAIALYNSLNETQTGTELAKGKTAIRKLFQQGVATLTPITAQSQQLSYGKQLVKTIATSAALIAPVMDTYLLYKGFRIISDKWLPLPFLTLLSIGPEIYLQTKLNQKSWTRTYENLFTLKAADLQCPKTIGSFIGKSVKWVMISSITLLGLAADVTLVRDHIGLDAVLPATFSLLYLSVMGTLVFNSLVELANDLEEYFENRKRSAQQIEADEFCERLEFVEEYIREMPLRIFSIFLDSLSLAPAQLQQLDPKQFEGSSKKQD